MTNIKKLRYENKTKERKMKCRERLLNPHRLKLNFSILPIVEADGEKYRMFYQTIVSIATGSCQCFKDCDCAADKGKRTEKIKIWYRNIKFDDTGKCFYSEPYTPPQITI